MKIPNEYHSVIGRKVCAQTLNRLMFFREKLCFGAEFPRNSNWNSSWSFMLIHSICLKCTTLALHDLFCILNSTWGRVENILSDRKQRLCIITQTYAVRPSHSHSSISLLWLLCLVIVSRDQRKAFTGYSKFISGVWWYFRCFTI